MKVNSRIDTKIHNRFDIYIRKSGEPESANRQIGYAQNIVLNQLWSRLLGAATFNGYFNYIFLGTGSGTLAATRTSLFAHLGYKAASAYNKTADYMGGLLSNVKYCQLLETEYVGSTLTEVGIAYGTTSTNLCTHAVIKDMNGNPISIEKTALDIITIYATVFVHYGANGVVGGNAWAKMDVCDAAYDNNFLYYLMLGDELASNYDYPSTLQVSQAFGYKPYSFNNTMLRYTVLPTPTIDTAARTISFAARVPAASGNFGGLNSICLHNDFRQTVICHVDVDPGWYAGSPIVGEALGTGDGVTTDFNTAFDRVRAGSKVYVDGVEQTSGVTVQVGKPHPNRIEYMGHYFGLLSTDPAVQDGFSGWSTTTYCSSQTAIFYNPYWALGTNKMTFSSGVTAYISDDTVNWVAVTSNVAIDEAYRYYKYVKLVVTGGDRYCYVQAYNQPSYVVRFDTAPANGAVITIDYTTDTIAKDENHVCDIEFTMAFGEYTP